MNARQLIDEAHEAGDRETDVRLADNADTSHESVAEWYDSYGAHTSTEHHGDLEVQTVASDWLEDDLSDEEIATELRGAFDELGNDEIESMIALARRVWDAAEGVVSSLDAAVEAYQAGNIEGVLDALRAARADETDHGDDPATSALAAKLLASNGASHWPL